MAKIVFLSKEQVNANIGNGKNLGLSPVQCDSLSANFKNKVSEYHKNLNTVNVVESVNEAASVSSPGSITNPEEVIAPPVEPNVMPEAQNVIEESPVISNPVSLESAGSDLDSDVIQPFAPDAPAIDSVLNMGNPVPQDISTESVMDPVVPPAPVESSIMEPEISKEVVAQPEIVSAVQETDFDLMKQEIEKATEDYKKNVLQIMEVYEKKINETIRQANEYKEKAQEHLKNAQAAEQIAEIARQNSQKVQDIQNSIELEKIA